MPTPSKPPTRDKMTEAEKAIRDRIIRRWIERHPSFPSIQRMRFDTGFKDDTARVRYWEGDDDVWLYTTTRMFDNRFWSFRYTWNRSRGEWVLVKTSLRRHGKRKVAKERANTEGVAAGA
jgi:hypothetical protein